MTLATICNNALEELGGFEIPGSFFGNNNITARQCVALVRREGRTLERNHRWSELISTHTFTTVSGQANYVLPDDFRAFANMSQWDRSNTRSLIGPTSSYIWQYLKGGVSTITTIDRWFRLQGGEIYIHPTPTTSGDTIAYDYYSKNWIDINQTGLPCAEFLGDNDTPRLDENLLELALKWRFLQAKGMPYEPEYKEYEAVKDEVLADGGGKGEIRLGKPKYELTNLPDTGFGGAS